MKKKLISLLLAIAMVLSFCVPAMAIGPEGNVLPGAVDNVITLDKDYGTETVGATAGTEFNFSGFTGTLNLNGHKLMGSVTNATGVTVENRLPVYTRDEDNQPTTTVDYYEDTPAYLLAATGTYANDVSKYVADGYDVRGEGKNEVFSNEDNSVFEVVVDVEGTDRDASSENILDVFANDTITVKIKVVGARYVSANMTLTWDKNLFTDVTKSWDIGGGGWNKQESGDWRFSQPYGSDSYYQDGDIIGTFKFKAKYIDEEIVKAYTDENYTSASTQSSYSTFTVKSGSDSGIETAVVIGSWRQNTSGYDEPMATENLQDDVAHIILMDAMTGDVSAKTGLTYKGSTTPQNLLDTTYNNNTGFSALVGGVAPTGNDGQPSAKVATVVMPKSEYYQSDGVTPKENLNIDYGTANTALTTADIQGTNAGDYVVCYKISAPGYASVTGVKNVNIAKQKVDLVWSAPVHKESVDDSKKFVSGTGEDNAYNYVGQYDGGGFKAPTATYTSLDNNTIVTLGDNEGEILTTDGPNGPNSTLKDVGVYEFTAADDPNYEFNNPTVNVKVNGQTITGWTLKATNYEHTGEGNDVTNGVIWRDGTERPIGYLDVADDASFKESTTEAGKYYTTGENPVEVTNVHVTYEWSEGKYYTTQAEAEAAGKNVGDEIWTPIDTTGAKKVAELGKYKLRMTVTADNYEKMVQDVNFEIKNPIFVTENLEYVAGYSIVLVYTDETGVAFRYNNTQMYDVTKFGYKYNNNQYNNGTANYKYVYATVVKGAADTSLVYASNDPAKQFDLPAGWTNMMPTGDGYMGNESVNDVNNKSGEIAKAELKDVTAIQSIYNVNANNMLDMEAVLRSDVNRDKRVDVGGDVAQALAYYLANH